MRIFCAKKKGNTIELITKSDTAPVRANTPLYLPLFSEDIRYEFTYAVKINRVAKYIKKEFANRYYSEYGAAVNFHAADLLLKLKQEGAPTDLANAFDNSVILSDNFTTFPSSTLSCRVNEQELALLDWNSIHSTVDEALSYISEFIMLKIGDIVLINTCEEPSVKATVGDTISICNSEGEIILEKKIN